MNGLHHLSLPRLHSILKDNKDNKLFIVMLMNITKIMPKTHSSTSHVLREGR